MFISTKEVSNLSHTNSIVLRKSTHQSVMSVSGCLCHVFTLIYPLHTVYLVFLSMTPLSTPSLSLKPFKSIFSQNTFERSSTSAACILSIHSTYISMHSLVYMYIVDIDDIDDRYCGRGKVLRVEMAAFSVIHSVHIRPLCKYDAAHNLWTQDLHM